jgi:hypothetical protein
LGPRQHPASISGRLHHYAGDPFHQTTFQSNCRVALFFRATLGPAPAIIPPPLAQQQIPAASSTYPSFLQTHTLSLPYNPLPRRYSGFGCRDANRFVAFTQPSPFQLFHLSWPYLTPADRHTLCLAAPVMTLYAKLRVQASSADISPLLRPRPPPDSSAIDEHRVHLLGCAFLRFNCDYGDMIRWLEGPYTDSHRDWSAAFATFETVRHSSLPPGFPPPDYERTFRSCLEGVPLRAHFYSDYHSCALRNTAKLSADLVKK